MTYSLNGVYEPLKRLGIVWISARSRSPYADAVRQVDFEKNCCGKFRQFCPLRSAWPKSIFGSRTRCASASAAHKHACGPVREHGLESCGNSCRSRHISLVPSVLSAIPPSVWCCPMPIHRRCRITYKPSVVSPLYSRTVGISYLRTAAP
nr:hypothetical protein [Noviherbaspirillum sp. Root189]